MNESFAESRTLDRFALLPGCSDGIAIGSLDPGTVITVDTKHSRYRLVLLDHANRRALVTGGDVFPEPCEVTIEGATAGGSALKMGWIGLGLRLEFAVGRRRITTSRVRFVTIDSVPSPAPVSITPH